MKTIATVALSNFPYWKMCMEKLREQVDLIYVRVDVSKECKLHELIESKLADKIITSSIEWNRWNWREEMLDMCRGEGADIVLIPDHDEMFEDTIKEELVDFYNSGKDMMFFSFTNPTIDGREVREYPTLKHCTAFRWRDDLTYFPYSGLAMPTNYATTKNIYFAKTKVKHFCFYTPELEAEKVEWVKKEYGVF